MVAVEVPTRFVESKFVTAHQLYCTTDITDIFKKLRAGENAPGLVWQALARPVGPMELWHSWHAPCLLHTHVMIGQSPGQMIGQMIDVHFAGPWSSWCATLLV